MKLTIIPVDGSVYKDGVSYGGLDLSSVPENVHALQGDTNAGWIEFKNESDFRKPANESIDMLPDWAEDALVKFDEANLAQETAEALTLAELQKQRIPVTTAGEV